MSEKIKLSDREMQVIAAAFNCMDTKPKIDLHKLASRTNYASTASANNAWAAIQKKLRMIDEELLTSEELDETPKKSKPKSGTQAPDNSPVGSPVPATSVKKRGRPKGSASAATMAKNDGDADATETEENEIKNKKKKKNEDIASGGQKIKSGGGKPRKGAVAGAEEGGEGDSTDDGVSAVRGKRQFSTIQVTNGSGDGVKVEIGD